MDYQPLTNPNSNQALDAINWYYNFLLFYHGFPSKASLNNNILVKNQIVKQN